MGERIRLQRTGMPPVAFEGVLLAEIADAPVPYEKAKADYRRWHELKLYRHSDGRHVLAIGFRSRHETETPVDTVIVCDTIVDAYEALRDEEQYDPCEFLEGFPTDWPDPVRKAKMERKQRILEDRVNDDYDRRVSQLLAAADYEEEI